MSLAALLNLGGGEIILILALILILFGAKKLPELAEGLGKGFDEFREGVREVVVEFESRLGHVTLETVRFESLASGFTRVTRQLLSQSVQDFKKGTNESHEKLDFILNNWTN